MRFCGGILSISDRTAAGRLVRLGVHNFYNIAMAIASIGMLKKPFYILFWDFIIYALGAVCTSCNQRFALTRSSSLAAASIGMGSKRRR